MRSGRNRALLVAFSIAGRLALAAPATPPAGPAPTGADARAEALRAPRLQIAGCPREAGEYAATYEDRVVLHRAFLDEKLSEAENIRLAIEQQLKYFWGFLRTSHKDASLLAVLSTEPPEITILKRSEVGYGRDLVIDWKETSKRLAIEDVYTLKAVARGSTKRDDPALAIDYRIRFRIALCGEARGESSSLTVPLPADPWLFFWHVADGERRQMRYFSYLANTNPCSDDDFAELPLPYYYWYDWWPSRKGRDEAGRAYDCQALLHEGRDFFPRAASLARLAAPSPDFSVLAAQLSSRPGGKEPLSATVLIGALDHEWKDLPLADLQRTLGAGRDLVGAVRRTREWFVKKGDERGTLLFLRYLADLREVATVARFDSAVEGAYLRVTAHGTLRRSGRAIAIHNFLGLTDIFGPTPPTHWSILRRALGRDAIIVYDGHSGIGENFRLAQIAQHLGEEEAAIAGDLARVPYQIVAFLSCYSYMYFGRDLVAAQQARLGPSRGAGREYIYTGTEFTKGDRGSLSILDLVDQVLASPRKAPTLRYVDPEDFLLVKEYRP